LFRHFQQKNTNTLLKREKKLGIIEFVIECYGA